MIIRGGTVVTSDGHQQANIAIEDEWIVAVGPNADAPGEEIDATGYWIFPGGIDSHVHFNEPGRTDWEDIEHGTGALAAGGYTAFIDMPLNNLPVTTTVEAFDLKLAAMKRSSKVDYGLWAGLVPENLDQIEPLVARGAMGFKAFMCPSGIEEFPACDQATLREGMQRIAEAGSILLVHAEDPSLLREPAGPTAADFVASRPPEAEIAAIETAIRLGRETGCRLHIVHVSTGAGADLISEAERRGVDVSGETCTHYLLYTAEDHQRLGGVSKCAPPFRTKKDQERLQQLDIVVSDHSPSTLDLKGGDDFRRVWGGISGCQTTRQILLTQPFGPSDIVLMTSTRVAQRFGIPHKGDIAAGFDADLWIVDVDRVGLISSEYLLYKNRFSAHEGQKIRGRTIRTLVRGHDPSPGVGKHLLPSLR